jgi:TnpA family transposase
MPVAFLTQEQRDSFGRYAEPPGSEDLERYFHLSDDDMGVIRALRGNHNRLGYAVQLTTLRYLGTFPDDFSKIPHVVLLTLCRQLELSNPDHIRHYIGSRGYARHAAEIQARYGYRVFSDTETGLRFARWLYALCWTGTDRPGELFKRATTWLLANKVLLPGVTILERFVSQLRSRVEKHLWRTLGCNVSPEQKGRLLALLTAGDGERTSHLEQLRSGPVRISGPSLIRAVHRLDEARNFGIHLPAGAHIPPGRIAALARFANTAKTAAINRLPASRRLATLVAFAVCLEATANDDVLELLEALLRDLFSEAEKTDKKARLRSLKDLDSSAATLADACVVLVDASIDDKDVRSRLFADLPRDVLLQALEEVRALIRPPDDVLFHALDECYRSVRRYLPHLLATIRFNGNTAGEPVLRALDWLRNNLVNPPRSPGEPPGEVVLKSWKKYVWPEGGFNQHAYIFCVLDVLREAISRRDVFVSPSWRYADPRLGLLEGEEWLAARPVICRSLGLTADAKSTLSFLIADLEATWQAVAARLPENTAVRLTKTSEGKTELSVSPLEKFEEPSSLVQLRKTVSDLMPRVDLPEILLEISARTSFALSFTHVSEGNARADNLGTSLCAVLLSEACNTGLEPLIRADTPALRRDRLAWVRQNYIRDETLTAANVVLVREQSKLALARLWGGGEVASADGIRFVVPVRTIHARPNPKYFGIGRGLTLYNVLSDQFSGLNAIPVPGTLRDSLVLLAVMLEQQTDLQPTQIMTDTGAYSDVVFGLFRLLGYHFSPRLADVGGTRFWRVLSSTDYGALNGLARQIIRLNLIEENWDDLLRLAGSLKLGRIPATSIMRTLQSGAKMSRLAKALAEFGRIDKTLHVLTYIDSEEKRRAILTQLNRGESRHSLAREVFHGKRGELRQQYREGQEDQLGSLGLVLNIIVLWNTIYMGAALEQIRRDGYPVHEEDVARLSPLGYSHINMEGRYSFAIPEEVVRGELRPLHDPQDDF